LAALRATEATIMDSDRVAKRSADAVIISLILFTLWAVAKEL
jgi:hypothetical protein